MPETRVLVNFAPFGFKTVFLIKFLDDSAWFCFEELRKHVFFQSKAVIFDQKTDLDPNIPERNWKIPFNRAPLRGP